MKNQLMRTVLSVLLVSSLFLSCEKEKDASFFIKFKADNDWVSFTKVGFIIEETNDPSRYFVTIAGRSDDMEKIFIIGVEVPSDLQPGAFDSENDGLEFGYGINAGPGSDPTKYYTMYPVTDKPNPHFVLNITSMSENEIRGNFTGNYLADADENFIEITEGQFIAKKEQ